MQNYNSSNRSKIQIPSLNGNRIVFHNPNGARVYSYNIEHAQAESLMTKSNSFNYLDFIYSKDYFGAKRLRMVVNSNIHYTITFSHHDNILSTIELDDSVMNTEETITYLSSFIRGLWCFSYQINGENQDVKFPSYHGQHLIKNELLKNSKTIDLLSRTQTASKKYAYGKQKFSYLRYISTEDREIFLENLRKPTIYTLKKLVKDRKLFNQIKENQNEYRLKKNQCTDE